MAGLFITLEGIDGCGKSTQIEALADELARRGVDAVVTREPGGTSMGERIRRLLSEAGNSMAAETELLLIVAARAQHVRELITPALEAGRVVISDRYTDSSLAFQGYGRGLDLATVDEMNRFATGGLTPDLTILFDLDPARARARLDRRTRTVEPDEADSDLGYFDREERAFHERVRDGYLRLLEREPSRIRLVDSSGPVEHTREGVLSLVLPLLKS
ncbi:MAG TPA: dTMP kinase [Blastocatellia bacterium]|nr:dTMP kinase [Blastocatellia bacterium]